MKQTENNEMDLLLRRLVRSEGARSVTSEDHSAMHLDADELNSYAEQALPLATRARYTSHLAECASCRKIVADLKSASGAQVSDHSVSQETSGLWQKLASFFSPGLRRYAVTAIAILAFIAIGLVVLRQQSRPQLVAVNQPWPSGDGVHTPTAVASPTESGNSAVALKKEALTESETSADKNRDNLKKLDEKQGTAEIAGAKDSVVVSDSDQAAGKAAGAVAQPSYAPEPAAAPPAKPQTTRVDTPTEVAAQRKEEVDKIKNEAKREEAPREQEGARARRDENQNQASSPQSRPGSLASKSQEKLRTSDEKRASGSGPQTYGYEAAIRTVSGKKFRRQGGTWIDISYQSSTATTSVVRGSEQYRALVADEPGIRAIAEQLVGEIVLMWKGRAYRIR